jgi:hypothetical protein
MQKYNNYTNHTYEGIKVNREYKYIKAKSYKGKIQRYTSSPKNSPEPERSSTLPNSQLELICCIGESSPNSLVLCLDLNERWPPGGGRGRPYIGRGGVEAK